MQQAERSLGEIMAYERIAGQNLEMIKVYGKQLVKCLALFHGAGVAHADIKPSNILRDRHSRELKLADFDAAANFGHVVGQNADGSSCYIPPECAHIIASVAYEAWMLRATLFELLTSTRLFPAALIGSDSIDPTCMVRLKEWSWLSEDQKLAVLSDCDANTIELGRHCQCDRSSGITLSLRPRRLTTEHGAGPVSSFLSRLEHRNHL